MILGIQASRSFDDYAVFLRAMRTVLSTMEDGDQWLYVYSAGPAELNSMAIGFANITEKSLKAQGIKMQVRKVPAKWFKEYMHEIDMFAYFCKPKEPASDLVDLADDRGTSAYVYRFA